jgi:predicted O-methyltransferase YrrM
MKKTKYSDKILPNQEFFRHLYHDGASFEDALHALMSSYSTNFAASRFDLVQSDHVDFEEMSTPPWQLALFNAMIKLRGARTVLEIGSFVGHSAMQFAHMVGEKGHVTTIEMGKDFAALARENFRRNKLADRITLLEGDAGTVLSGLTPRSFDLIFVDGSKQDYLEYTLKSKELLTERGLIIVDDVFFHGDALNAAPNTDKGKGCKAVLDHFRDESSFERLLLPVANGILILYKAGSDGR